MAMGSSAAATAVAALPSKGWSQDMIGDYLDEVRSSRSASAPRRVVIHNLHTDERVDAIYFDEGRYVPDALAAVNHVMRDYRTGDVHFMEPQLLDLMHVLSAKVESRQPFQIISGYRSPKTNAMLHERSSGVAVNSFHMRGMATDIRLPDVSLPNLHRAALAMQRGGVGYYPESDFVHVDVGPVRTWG
jgi:uncharacterized protein YcbK (DUF882 family)